MGKHDMRTPTTSEEHLMNRIKELEKRLKFEQENNAKLKAEISKYNRWVSEIQANAQDKLDEKDAKIAILQGKVLKLVNDYV